MTYCVALKLEAGLVFASDSRTHAGIDQIASFKKMRTFVEPGDRTLIILSSGNLSVTQTAIHLLERESRQADQPNLWNVDSLIDVAGLLGDCLRRAREQSGASMVQSPVDFSAQFIIGGQVGREPMRLCLIYPEGNFIEASDETPFFQIGETKYGKPILDRVIQPSTPLSEAVKCVLVSFDSTMRSNLSVGLPIDVACYVRDTLEIAPPQHITEEDPYFAQLSKRWSEGLRGLFASLPDPDWYPGEHQSGPDPRAS